MPRFTRSMAVFAAVASMAVVAAAPAGAQDVDLTWDARNACVEQPSLPGCVDYAFDTADWAVDTTRNTYNNVVQPAVDEGACFVYEFATNEECPTRGMIPTLP